MDIGKATQIVVIMLSPTLSIGAVLYAPRVFRTMRRIVRRTEDLRPIQRPIEQVAADLRRLLLQHETLRRSTGVAMRAQHLWALEAAITDCAFEAAQALGVPAPDRPLHGALSTSELRRLLLAVAEAGLMLPPAVLLTADDRRP